MSAQSIFTIPNLLTGYRFAAAPVLLFLLMDLDVGVGQSLVAFVLFLTAALTDLADGYYARKHKIETVLGKLMDPLADKVLITVALVMLIPMGRIPAWVVFVILSRELVITGLRGVAADAGVVVAASNLGKIKSVLQYIALCVLIFPLGVLPVPFLHELGLVILYVSAFMTVWSGVDYFYRFQKVYLPGAQK
ncbi:MAG: CDP-diacylglycerol--glycerol-3-phosphate 3-phosphatidyltransferase [Desulfobulbaceae bacterium]|nr:CDP-diacylglycerol--glycerol-3-phosphate 3-phosphatidyltransferase [Desulfobulbaceae bacterium]HIJ79590.1 CDP-diacylglycerol--glycerol-3-phosphate 3-phosphatidyltransferase [Deltaproteobacteria bacterium]